MARVFNVAPFVQNDNFDVKGLCDALQNNLMDEHIIIDFAQGEITPENINKFVEELSTRLSAERDQRLTVSIMCACRSNGMDKAIASWNDELTVTSNAKVKLSLSTRFNAYSMLSSRNKINFLANIYNKDLLLEFDFINITQTESGEEFGKTNSDQFHVDIVNTLRTLLLEYISCDDADEIDLVPFHLSEDQQKEIMGDNQSLARFFPDLTPNPEPDEVLVVQNTPMPRSRPGDIQNGRDSGLTSPPECRGDRLFFNQLDKIANKSEEPLLNRKDGIIQAIRDDINTVLRMEDLYRLFNAVNSKTGHLHFLREERRSSLLCFCIWKGGERKYGNTAHWNEFLALLKLRVKALLTETGKNFTGQDLIYAQEILRAHRDRLHNPFAYAKSATHLNAQFDPDASVKITNARGLFEGNATFDVTPPNSENLDKDQENYTL